MIRLLVVPVLIGVSAFLSIYLVAPLIVAEPGIVSYVAGFALYLSNSYFESMPPIIAGYIANLNLAIAALTAGLLLTVVVQLVVIIGGTSIGITRRIILYLQKDRSKEAVQDMPPIEIDSKFMNPGPGEKILGRGLDSIERD